MSSDARRRNLALQSSGNLRDNLQFSVENAALFDFPGMPSAYRRDIEVMALLVPA